MINGRPIPPLLKIAIAVILGFVVVGQLIHYALLPTAVALVAWGGYQIYKSERGAIPRAPKANSFWARRTKPQPKGLKIVRIDRNKDLTVPKDWR